MDTSGRVYLVGAGPGDPGLITVKGLECIRQADVIIYDRLVNPGILRYALDDAQLIYAGKMPGSHEFSQQDINDLMMKMALEGKQVVRLKGGDPFVFGRGAEEAIFLHEHGIAFEVVPGVTSAVAVPAYAGIPVTHRGIASTFCVIAGHEDPNKKQDGLDWSVLAALHGTLVFLMGVENLKEISEKLVEYGQPSDRPAAIIQRGTTGRQKTLISTLGELPKEAVRQMIVPPAVIVVGETVLLHRRLQWFENRPLFGKRIVITRAREQAGELKRLLEDQGADVVEMPTIRIAALSDYSELDMEIANLERYQWLIFTSKNAVHYFLNRLRVLRKDIRDLASAKLCAVGPATRSALEESGLMVHYMPKVYNSEELAVGVSTFIKPGEWVLVPRAQNGSQALTEHLSRTNINIRDVAVYSTETEQPQAEKLLEDIQNGDIDWVTFTSPSAARNFSSLLKHQADVSSLGLKAACIGQVTAGTAQAMGFEVKAQPTEQTIAGLIKSIVEYENSRGDI